MFYILEEATEERTVNGGIYDLMRVRAFGGTATDASLKYH